MGSATVDRENETVDSLDEELSTKSRPHVLSLVYSSKTMDPSVRDKLPTGHIIRRSSSSDKGGSIKLGRGKDMDVLLNDVHIPRTFVEVWFALDEGWSEARWFIKNLSDKKSVRISYLDGSKKVMKQNEQGEVRDNSKLRLDTLEFTAKIEEGDVGEVYDFELEFLPLEADSRKTSSGSSYRQSSINSRKSLTCHQIESCGCKPQLHLGECVVTQRLPNELLPPGQKHSPVIQDHNDPGLAAGHSHNQPRLNQRPMMLQTHPFHQPFVCSQAHYLPKTQDCANIHCSHNLHGTRPYMLGIAQPWNQPSTWQMQPFLQSIHTGETGYHCSLGGGTFNMVNFSQPVQPIPMHQDIYNQNRILQQEQQQGYMYMQASGTFGKSQPSTNINSTYVTQQESAMMYDLHNEHRQSHLITTPTTEDQNPQLYVSETKAEPTWI